MTRFALFFWFAMCMAAARGQPPAVLARPPELALPTTAVDLGILSQSPAPHRFEIDDNSAVTLLGITRGFYRNDQRIEWSGVEDTFGGEGIIRARLDSNLRQFRLAAEAEVYMNVPNGRSILSDADRDLYRENFTVPPFFAQQLFVEFARGDFSVRLGRFRTPLGRSDSPVLTNSFLDVPFIRTEIVGFTETGMLGMWNPGLVSLQAGITNGEGDLDTNSSKALIARAGLGSENWAIGVWIKAHDGTSSEQQKRFNSFIGLDAKVTVGRVTVYGEGVYDQHGLYRDLAAEGNPLALAPRSLYGRDVYIGHRKPIWGGGFDVGVLFRENRWLVDLNYGVYFPQAIGVVAHDQFIHRGVVKVIYSLGPRVQLYGVGLVENNRAHEVSFFDRARPFALLGGVQMAY